MATPYTTIKARRDTAENWATLNPTLDAGEFGFEIDTFKLKIGNGQLSWDDLPYQAFPEGVIPGPGPKGDRGNTGAAGPTGDRGPQGDPGPQGVAGPTGPKGDSGAQGIQGLTGEAGAKGDSGSSGSQGVKGDQGARGPTGDAGATGPKGDTGAKGDLGSTGPAGQAGPKGDAGIQGLKGDTGSTGAAGAKGDTGLTGAMGLKGDTGATGMPGSTGPAGAKGEPGEVGPQGSIGAAGPTGPVGPQGIKGDTGLQGAKGDTGATGTPGAQGTKGDNGDAGATGPRGFTGAAGAAGATGPAGAQGDIGPIGPRGYTGSQGPGGSNGTAVLSGSGVPSITLGKNGDFYYDIASGAFYGPKALGTWPTGVLIVGQNGLDGLNVLSGPSNPGGGTGRNGEFFLNYVTMTMFGPKSAGAWPTGVSLIGPTGAVGPTGATGATGSTGATGAAGTNGTNGAAGTNGTNGVDGRTTLNGSGTPSNALGANGDFYIDNVAHTIAGPKAAGVWPAGVSLIGPTGATGSTGSTGATGSSAGSTLLRGMVVGDGSTLQPFDSVLGEIVASPSLLTVTLTIAAPAIVQITAAPFGNNLVAGQPVKLSTTGALPSPLTAGNTYYVGANLSGSFFALATSYANAMNGVYISTVGGSQSGVHSINSTALQVNRTFTSKLSQFMGLTEGSVGQALSTLGASAGFLWKSFLTAVLPASNVMIGDANGAVAQVDTSKLGDIAADYISLTLLSITIAAPAVLTTAIPHGLNSGDKILLTTTGALPTGLSANTVYYALVTSTTAFKLCTTYGNVGVGNAITTTGSQSGFHTVIGGGLRAKLSNGRLGQFLGLADASSGGQALVSNGVGQGFNWSSVLPASIANAFGMLPIGFAGGSVGLDTTLLGDVKNTYQTRVVTAVATGYPGQCTIVAHGFKRGECYIPIISGGTIGGLNSGQPYYIIPVTADTFYLATSRANAFTGTTFAFSSNTATFFAWTGPGLQMPYGILGRSDGAAVSGGNIGQLIESKVTAIGISTTVTNVTSIPLTPGEWDIYGAMNVYGASGPTSFSAGINSLSASFSALNQGYDYGVQAINSNGVGFISLRKSVSISVATTYFLPGQCNTGTETVYASLSARRMA